VHSLSQSFEQALMINPIEKFRQVEVYQDPVSGLEVFFCFGNSGVSAAVRTKSMTTWVEGWLKDRLQYLQRGLLNPPVDHIWDSQASLSASWFFNPYPPDVSRLICALKEYSLQLGQ
jgi:hypothetical protein